jgi:hypothetical protein
LTRIGDAEPGRIVQNVAFQIGATRVAFFPNVGGGQDAAQDPSKEYGQNDGKEGKYFHTKYIDKFQVSIGSRWKRKKGMVAT